jgi:hypothetical protein
MRLATAYAIAIAIVLLITFLGGDYAHAYGDPALENGREWMPSCEDTYECFPRNDGSGWWLLAALVFLWLFL